MKLVLLSLCVVLFCSQLIAATTDPLIHEVATSFVFKGYVRETPYDLSPMEKEHLQMMEQNNARAREMMKLPTLPALVEEKEVEHRSRPLASNSPSLVESQGIIDGAAKIFGAGKNLVNSLTGKYKPSYSQIYEDCMACRMVWKQVEMDISNARYVEDVQASFEHNCMDAQKSVIFYKACEDMYDDMYALTDDYMSGKYTVTQMCQRAKMCVEPSQST